MKRIMPLGLALWYLTDIGLDINQSITYHEMAYDEDGSYRKWLLRHKNEVNVTFKEDVAPWYFYAAWTEWIVPSFLLVLRLPKKFELLLFILHSFHSTFRYDKAESKVFEKCLTIVISIVLLPSATVISFLFIHLILPLNVFCNAVCKVIKGDDFDEESTYGFLWNAKSLTVGKGLEIFGRALPQVCLNIVFICNHYPYLNENDIDFGMTIRISIVSAVFSIGSLAIGCVALCRCCGCMVPEEDEDAE